MDRANTVPEEELLQTSSFALQLGPSLISTLKGALVRQPVDALAALFEISADAIRQGLSALNLPPALEKAWRRGPIRNRWSMEDTRRALLCHLAGTRTAVTAAGLGRSVAAVYRKTRSWNAPKRARSSLTDVAPQGVFAVVESPIVVTIDAVVDIAPAVASEAVMSLSTVTPETFQINWTPEASHCNSPASSGLVEAETPSVTSEMAAPMVGPARKQVIAREFPPEVRGFVGPSNAQEFERFARLMAPNLRYAIRAHLRRRQTPRETEQQRRMHEEAEHTALANLFTHFTKPSKKDPSKSHYTNYDPNVFGADKPIEFCTWVASFTKYVVQDVLSKKLYPEYKRQAVTTGCEINEDFDQLVRSDANAFVQMGSASVETSPEQVLDLKAIQDIIRKVSTHFYRLGDPKYIAEMCFEPLMASRLENQSPEEICLHLSRHTGQPITKTLMKRYLGALHDVYRMYRDRGPTGVLQHYAIA